MTNKEAIKYLQQLYPNGGHCWLDEQRIGAIGMAIKALQGEHKPNFCHHEVDLSNCSEEYRNAYYDGWNNCNMQHSQFKSELDDVIKCLINGMKFYYEDNEEATWGTDKWSMPVKHIIEVLEAQGSQNFANAAKTCKDEQKPADKVEHKFKVGDIIRLNGTAVEYTIRRVTDTTYYTDGWSCGIERCEEDYELVEQAPIWGEEDEKQARQIQRIVHDDGCTQKLQEQIADWLKSLKDRYTWKPSDEQMKALKHASNDCSIAFADMKILATLYEQLKALHRYEQDT